MLKDVTIIEYQIKISSSNLNREVSVTVFAPEGFGDHELHNLLLLNDGQDALNLRLKDTFFTLTDKNLIKPVIIVAIHAGDDRLNEYGTAGKPDFKKRGSKAAAYTEFIKSELFPAIDDLFGNIDFDEKVFGGFSLGGLSALDIVWNNPQLFDKAGVFSGSFWWRAKDLTKGYTDNDRIMHSIVKNTATKPAIKMWLQTGTNDETADRNNNGIIDSIDDTVDLISELELKGFNRPTDIQYVELVGGSHDTETWARVMPKFLIWAFGR